MERVGEGKKQQCGEKRGWGKREGNRCRGGGSEGEESPAGDRGENG